MTDRTIASRRNFLKAGALLATPLAAALPVAAGADEGLKARLAQLEDEAAIRLLHRQWLQDFNAAVPRETGEACTIAADGGWDPDALALAGDRAQACFACTVEIATAIALDCTLGQMAHAQGNGPVLRTERRVLDADYVRTPKGWALARAELRAF